MTQILAGLIAALATGTLSGLAAWGKHRRFPRWAVAGLPLGLLPLVILAFLDEPGKGGEK